MIFFVRNIVVFFLPIFACFLSAAVGLAEESTLSIEGSYSGTALLKGATYIVTIPDLPIRTLGHYAQQKPDTGHNGFRVDIWIDANSKTPQYRLYIFQDEWTLRKPSNADAYDIELAGGAVKNFAQFARVGAVVEFPAPTIEGKMVKATDSRDLRNLSKNQIAKGEITLCTVTIRQGIATHFPRSRSASNPNDLTHNPAYKAQYENAQKAGLNINTVLDRDFVALYNGSYFYLLYYNMAEAPGCDTEYLLQRVKISKTYLDQKGNKVKPDTVQYLVEAFKLDGHKRMKRADEHMKCYGLENAYKRQTTVDIEIGVGKIPGLVEGRAWPFERNTLYNQIQGYSTEPKLYDKVAFDYSKVYSYYSEFDASGKYDVRHTD